MCSVSSRPATTIFGLSWCEVTEQGATIDVLVTGPTGPRASTTAMENLANDPRLDLT